MRRFLCMLCVIICSFVTFQFLFIKDSGAQANDNPLRTSTNIAELEERLSGIIPGILEDSVVPGISICVLRGGIFAWSGTFGVKNMETGEPVDEKTIFEAASLSKPVFSYAVLKLAGRGVIDLDTPLSDYLGRDYIEDERVRLITARIVMSHTPGFPNWRPRGKDLKIHNPPSEKFSYSGEGFVYLQTVVEHVTGLTLNEFMNREVFEPLQMSNSSYVWRESYDEQTSTGHNNKGEFREKRRPEKGNAAASLHTTAEDYARFISAVISGEGLRDDLHKEMLAPQVILPEKRKGEGRHPELSWGLGWGLQQTANGKAFWHWGDNGVFKCYTVTFPESGTGVVYFTNGSNGLRIAEAVLAATVGGTHPPLTWLNIKPYDRK